MAGQTQALFRRAHAKIMFPGSKRAVHFGVRKFQGRFAAAAGPVDRTRPYNDIPKSSTIADLNEISVNKVAEKLMESAMTYGTLFRVTTQLGTADELVVCDPADVKIIFTADGKWPIRLEGGPLVDEALEPLQPLGLALSDNYDSWFRQRQAVAKSMTAGRTREFTGGINAITNDLVERIYKLRDPETKVISDVLRLIIRWSANVWFYFALGKELKQFPPILSEEFLEAITEFEWFNLIRDVYFLSDKTKMVPIREGLQMMYNTFFPFIKEIVQENEERKKLTGKILPQYNFMKNLTDGTLSMREIVMSTMDVILPGIRVVSLNLVWCLYLLACEPVAQERLHKELHGAIGVEERSVTPSHINNMPYLERCFNEVLRLRGSPWYFNRVLQKDVVLSGYNIPANTSTIIPLSVIGRLPQFYSEPESFMPGRWSNDKRKTRPLLSFIPFGFGPRVCPGRQFAELQIYIALVQLMRRFQIEFQEEMPMGCNQMYAHNVPERQMNLAFKDL